MTAAKGPPSPEGGRSPLPQGAAASGAAVHSLVLIPWHIGNWADLTLNAARTVRRLRRFLAEDAEGTRSQFRSLLRLDCSAKEFLTIPTRYERAFLDRVLEALGGEDVGMVSSGGVPCFADPGGWLVREIRGRGIPIVALAGASSLATLLSLSGFDWIEEPANGAFSFVFYKREDGYFPEVLRREGEPVVVFLERSAFGECLRVLRDSVGERPVTAFFDLTKVPKSKFPYANQVRTMTSREWLREMARVRWDKVSDVALMVHPREAAR